MSKVIEKASSFEIRSVIKFLNAQKVRPAEISRQVCSVYGNNAMSDGMVRKWCRTFNSSKTNAGVGSTVNEDLLDVKRKIIENRITMTELSNNLPQTSKSLLDDVVKEHLLFHKVCTRWVASEEYSSVTNPSSSKCPKMNNSEEFVVAKSKKDIVYQYNKNREPKNCTNVVVKLEGDENGLTIEAIPFQLIDGCTKNSNIKIHSKPSENDEFTKVCLKVECEEQKVFETVQTSNLVITPLDAGKNIPKALCTHRIEIEDEETNETKNITKCVRRPEQFCSRRISKSKPRSYSKEYKKRSKV